MTPKLLLSVGMGLLGIILATTALVKLNHGSDASPGSSIAISPQEVSRKTESSLEKQTSSKTAEREIPKGFDSTLQAALAQTDPMRRAEALQQWADAVGTGGMEAMLAKLDTIGRPQLRSEIRRVLLSSWAERDAGGMVDWFGKRDAGDELHQQALDALVWDFGGRDPVAMVAWMEQLPESVRVELYAPFFRQWAETDPAGAAVRLRQLSDSSKANPARWNDLVGQVVAVWAGADLKGALAWIQSLPEGAIKSQALAEVSYRWTETAPQAAAAYAAREKDPALIKLVAAKWAETDPQSAAVWAARLPAGEGQDAATISAVVIWAQKDAAAAAAYAASLPKEKAQGPAVLAVVSAWSTTAPAQAAAWVEQFPENPVRGQAMGQLMSTWAGNDATAANEWLKTLPPSPSRDNSVAAYDNAVSIYSSVRSATSPASAFQSAGTIFNETLRNRSLQEIATAWLNQDQAAAQQRIVQSGLPANIKNQLLGNASQARQ